MAGSKDSVLIKENSGCAVIVAHPDDETLWTGGLMLMHPEVQWTVVTLCRKSDKDRAPKFFKALEKFGAFGFMGDLDDGPEQVPLNDSEVQDTIIRVLPSKKFDLIITHSTSGEYTRHLRHEETGKAVMALCKSERLTARAIWRFAYTDDEGKHLPQPVHNADMRFKLPEAIWQRKYDIITKVYGFAADSFEAKTTPLEEAFGCFR